MRRDDDHHLNPKIPAWNGNPATWEVYKDEVRIWLLGALVNVEYCLAARLVGQLRGPARQIGLSMSGQELWVDPPSEPPTAGGPAPPRTRQQATAGVDRLLKKLERLAPQVHQRRGLYMRDFLKDERFARRSGERIADWIPRWERGLELLRTDGIDLNQIANLSGWYFLEHSRIGESRTDMVRSSIHDSNLQYDLMLAPDTPPPLPARPHARGRAVAPQHVSQAAPGVRGARRAMRVPAGSARR